MGMSSVFGGGKATQEADNVIILQTRMAKDTDGRKVAYRSLDIKKNRFDGEVASIPLGKS
jgi:twinkle protein